MENGPSDNSKPKRSVLPPFFSPVRPTREHGAGQGAKPDAPGTAGTHRPQLFTAPGAAAAPAAPKRPSPTAVPPVPQLEAAEPAPTPQVAAPPQPPARAVTPQPPAFTVAPEAPASAATPQPPGRDAAQKPPYHPTPILPFAAVMPTPAMPIPAVPPVGPAPTDRVEIDGAPVQPDEPFVVEAFEPKEIHLTVSGEHAGIGSDAVEVIAYDQANSLLQAHAHEGERPRVDGMELEIDELTFEGAVPPSTGLEIESFWAAEPFEPTPAAAAGSDVREPDAAEDLESNAGAFAQFGGEEQDLTPIESLAPDDNDEHADVDIVAPLPSAPRRATPFDSRRVTPFESRRVTPYESRRVTPFEMRRVTPFASRAATPSPKSAPFTIPPVPPTPPAVPPAAEAPAAAMPEPELVIDRTPPIPSRKTPLASRTVTPLATRVVTPRSVHRITPRDVLAAVAERDRAQTPPTPPSSEATALEGLKEAEPWGWAAAVDAAHASQIQREAAAQALERIAARVRGGDVRIEGEGALTDEAVLADVLAAMLRNPSPPTV